MRIGPWVIIFMLLFSVYAFLGLLALEECSRNEDVLVCLLNKGGWKQK